jgi:flavin-dependent dehydrogenase
MTRDTRMDCTIVGASFAGLACARALARAGLRVTVMEKKRDAGEKLHTTGIIVRDAIDQIALLDGLPPELVRRIAGVRTAAGIAYFHHRGVFDPATGRVAQPAGLPPAAGSSITD